MSVTKHIGVIGFVLMTFFGAAQPFLELKDVKRLNDNINSDAEESYPIFDRNDRLYFVRSLFDGNVGGNRAGQDIWFVEKVGDGWTEPSNKLDKLNNKFNNGVVGVADSGRVLYLNSTYSNKFNYQLGISRTELNNGKWQKPQRVAMRGFDPDSRFFTFFVDEENGVMLMSFALKKVRNEDIYISFRKGLGWSKPKKLSTTINTPEAEFAPFLSQDGSTLYFSSNGHPGKGDVDIFFSKRIGNSWTNWTEPISLPEPINSSKFDAYFTIYETEAFFSSNRETEYADLYQATYEKRKIDEQIDSLEKEDLIPVPFEFIGFVAGEKLSGLKSIEVMNAEDSLVMEISPGDSGQFILSGLEDFSQYYINLKGRKVDDLEVYFQDRKGQKIYLSKEVLTGRYPFETLQDELRAIMLADVQDKGVLQSTLFKYDGGLPRLGAVVSLYDEYGTKIEDAKVGKDGGFSFEKLDPNKFYRIESDFEMDDTQLMMVSDSGNIPIEAPVINGLFFRKEKDGNIVLRQRDLLASQDAAKFQFDYENLDIKGSTVFLYNEDGEIIEKAFIDEEGLFAFKKLDDESDYRIGLEDDLDTSKVQLFGFDQLGQKMPLVDGIAMGDAFTGNPAHSIPKPNEGGNFQFDAENKPEAGTVVYLTDEEDNVIDSAIVDESGNFSFQRLTPDMKYKIKLADDKDGSMGLDRFFITDAQGNKMAMNKEGVAQPAVEEKKVVQVKVEDLSAIDEGRETFKFDDSEGAPPVGSTVYLTDENDIVVDSAIVDESGNFSFQRLSPDLKYKIKLADDSDGSMGLDRFFIIDAEGNKVAMNKEGVTVDEVVGKELASTTDKYQFDQNNAPQPGTVVYLTDNFNNIVDSAIIDDKGRIRFKRLDEKDNYKLKVQKTADKSTGLDEFFVFDAEGEKVAFNEEGESKGALIGKDAAANTEAFKFDESAGAPPVGSTVYLTDEEDNIIDSAVVDENGEFRFTVLRPFGNYKIKLDQTQDQSAGLSAFFVFDAAGNKVGFNDKGESTDRVVGKEEAKIAHFYKFGFKNLPSDGALLYVTDQNDEVVDSIRIKNGEFSYRKLDGEDQYGLQLKYADGFMYLGEQFKLEEKDGESIKLTNSLDQEDYFSQIPAEELAHKYDQFEFDSVAAPDVGSKLYVYSDAGFLLDSAILLSEGRFNVPKLKRQEDYLIKVGATGFRIQKSHLYTLVANERRKLTRLKDGFAYRPIGIQSLEDTEFNFDKYIIQSEAPIAENAQVFLVEDQSDSVVDSSAIAEDGSFQFKRTDQSKEYSLKFDDSIDTETAEVFAVDEESKKQLLPKSDNGFKVQPELMDNDDKGDELRLVLGSVKDDQNIEMKKTETSEQEVVSEEVLDPYPLTPPVDEQEEPLEVKESKLNETVFEPMPIKEQQEKAEIIREEKKTVTMAKAEMDDEDWRPYLEMGEVYKTKKGWNLHFGFNEFLLSNNQIDYIYKVVIPMLRANPKLTLVIEGHTDSIGSDEVNHRMAVLRASNVLYHLEMSDIEDTQLRIVAKGESEPIAPNSIPEGRAINRRVELNKNLKQE
ncbi:MAG: OmpA family protein [Salibacteraceae bacterium]